jgi:NitT/TauT family transport system substrate-binding protein
MKKIILWVAGIVMCAGVGYAVYNKPVAQPPALEKVTVAQAFEVFLYAPLYVAQEQGFFKDEGLEVTITTAGGPDKAFAALLGNNAQFAVADPTIVAISGEKGQPGKVVAGILRGVPFWGVAKKTDIGTITTPAGLKEYVVATTPSPSTAYTLQEKMFKMAGLKTNIKETQSGSLLAALEADQVDIALELEPNVSTAVKHGAHVVYGLNDYYPDFALTGLLVLPTYATEHRETVQKMVTALQRSLQYIRANPEKVTDSMLTRFPQLERDVTLAAVNRMIQSNVFPPDTLVTRSGWEVATQLRQDVGHLQNPAPYENYVITSFSEQAR